MANKPNINDVLSQKLPITQFGLTKTSYYVGTTGSLRVKFSHLTGEVLLPPILILQKFILPDYNFGFIYGHFLTYHIMVIRKPMLN